MRKASRDRPDDRQPRGKLAGSMAPRPRKPPGAARDKPLVVRVRPDEFDAITRRAELHGESVSELVRRAIRAELSRPGRPAKRLLFD